MSFRRHRSHRRGRGRRGSNRHMRRRGGKVHAKRLRSYRMARGGVRL